MFVLGSAHFISNSEKPLNCLHYINEGKIVNRYSSTLLTKVFCKVHNDLSKGGTEIFIDELSSFLVPASLSENHLQIDYGITIIGIYKETFRVYYSNIAPLFFLALLYLV
jgi:hypothetical protein